ncbi:unnamed protein product [Lota lota]
MFDLNKEWSISFAGCGFMGIYYVGAASCIFERFPQFFQKASKIYGASAGSLMSTILTIGTPLEKSCLDLMSMAREARKRKLGPLHPAFNLLQIVRDSLLETLPADAHVRASGKLCVSLTRVADGKNVIVSEFDTRDELIQVLLCSCFFPVYCGLIPPSYRGVRYMDGALSNNMPLFDQRNTITVSPFSGEADICPREGAQAMLAVHYGNLGIQVSSGNVNRICRSFFPPEPVKLAELSHNGYMDALRFLRGNDLLGAKSLSLAMLTAKTPTKPVCCVGQTQEKDNSPCIKLNVSKVLHQDAYWWLEQEVAQTLPASIQKVLCKACRESQAAGSQGMAPPLVKLFYFLLIPFTWSVMLIVSLISVMVSGCKLICSLMTSSGEKHQKIWGHRSMHARSFAPDQSHIIPLPLDLELRKWGCTDRRKETLPPASSPRT